jgi:hypothetical protein
MKKAASPGLSGVTASIDMVSPVLFRAYEPNLTFFVVTSALIGKPS